MTDDDDVVQLREWMDRGRRAQQAVDAVVAESTPIAMLELWLQRTVAVEVLRDEDGPYATPRTGVPEWPFTVWVSNGQPGQAWAGTLMARCKTQEDADLVGEALRRMQATKDLVEVERIEAVLRLISPEHITPIGARQIRAAMKERSS